MGKITKITMPNGDWGSRYDLDFPVLRLHIRIEKLFLFSDSESCSVIIHRIRELRNSMDVQGKEALNE